MSEELTSGKLEEIYKEGEERFKNEIPPGFKDKDKDGNSKYNDLVIWKEIIELSKTQKKDILFISDDRKEDWAIKFKGKDFGPRTELLKEFIKETNQLFYSITTKRFIEIISSIHNISNTELLIKETENITKNMNEKEKQIALKRVELLRLERDRYDKELLKEKLRKHYGGSSNMTELAKEEEIRKNDYYKVYLKENEILDEDIIQKKMQEKEIDDLKEKFIWNFLKDKYETKKDDDNESERFLFNFD